MNHIISTFENFLKPTNSFLKFILVGVINTCIGLSVIFLMMNGFHTGYWPATFIGNAAGASVSYVLNRNFTFQSKDSVCRSSIRFLAIILLSYFAAYSLSDQIIIGVFHHVDFQIMTNKEASVLLGACLYTLVNYIGQKYFVFKR